MASTMIVIQYLNKYLNIINRKKIVKIFQKYALFWIDFIKFLSFIIFICIIDLFIIKQIFNNTYHMLYITYVFK